MSPVEAAPHALFIDADDTLWENATFFRAARVAWRELAASRGHDATRARQRLREVEDEGLARREFGSERLRSNMVRVLAELEGEPRLDPRLEAACDEIAASIREHPIRFYPGALDVLAWLRERYPLVLVTMGEPGEQKAKIERSRIADHVHEVEIVHDKTADLYRALHLRHGRAAPSWMIGNSPSKDVAPARAAGLITVLFRSGAPMPPYFVDDDGRPAHVVDELAALRELL